MSNYIPHYTKKRQRQTKVENDLRRLIERGALLSKLIEAAEEVRSARIRSIYAKRQHCCIFGSADRYDKEIATIRSLSAAQILAEFGVKGELGELANAGQKTESANT